MSEYLGSLSAEALGVLTFLKTQGGSASVADIRERFGWSGAKFGAIVFNMKRKATNAGLDFGKKVMGKKGTTYTLRARVI